MISSLFIYIQQLIVRVVKTSAAVSETTILLNNYAGNVEAFLTEHGQCLPQQRSSEVSATGKIYL